MAATQSPVEPMLSRPRQLILTVTDRCNHFCDMCYYHASLNRRTNLLSLAEYRRIAAEVPDLELLLISGGEPFLRGDLAEIVEIFHQSSGVRSVFIPTNGSVPHAIRSMVRDMLGRMPDLQLTLMFSLEGLAATHDEIHHRVGAFAAVVETIRRLAPLRVHQHIHGRPPLGVLLNSVVTSRNLDQILPLMQFAKDALPISSHCFTPMRGRGPVAGLGAPSAAQFRALTEAAHPFFEHYLAHQPAALRATLDRYALWLRLIRGEGLPHQCQAGNYIGVIEPDGGVRHCELTPVIGNLRDVDFDFERLWFGANANAVRTQIRGCSCTHACFINASQTYYATVARPG
jgi:MoaA/NifB/PqqE/SkfB family radical SAM enzyme